MIEKIKTFFGKPRERGRVVVEEGSLWRCSQCHLLFMNKVAGDTHKCQDQKVN